MFRKDINKKILLLYRSFLNSRNWKYIYNGTASNKRLQFVVVAIGSCPGVATTHPFALGAQGRLQSGMLDETLKKKSTNIDCFNKNYHYNGKNNKQ